MNLVLAHSLGTSGPWQAQGAVLGHGQSEA